MQERHNLRSEEVVQLFFRNMHEKSNNRQNYIKDFDTFYF